MMIEYWSEDHELINWETELRKILGDKLVGLTVRTPNILIEIRTIVELEANEVNEVQKLTGKNWMKKKE